MNWSVRWLVNGHWRKQWFPNAGKHKVIWIDPYVKGPEDAPFCEPREVVAYVQR